KDSSGVVSGPIKEDEATALYKANFFRSDHVFRVVEANKEDDFTSIDDLRSLNGEETPFGQNGEEKEEKELIRVYKELSTVLKERNSLKVAAQKYEGAKKLMVEQFKKTMTEPNVFSVGQYASNLIRFTNKSSSTVRCQLLVIIFVM
ncbi:hypothetical protein PENTCL1PPCAC_21757, partial [Pristionchus entomophagus]